LSPILFNLYSEDLTTYVVEEFGDFRFGGEVICTVKYADELVLLAKKETTLQDMVEVGRSCVLEMNLESN
jgi:hypothetical protein